MRLSSYSVLPGLGPTLGFSLLYLGILVLLPLSALVLFAVNNLSAAEFWQVIGSPRVLASFRLSFGAAFIAALLNSLFGLILAWVLVRYTFPGRRLVDALIDLPFALPTAVAGIALTALFAQNGWFGAPLQALGIKVAYTPLGIAIAMAFTSLPFVVRTVQPVLEDVRPEVEEAAASLGATDWQIFRKVIFPTILPAFIAGCTLAFARSLGEFGAVIFIAGNQPMRTEIVALLTFIRLEEYDYPAAAALASTVLLAALLVLLLANWLQARSQRHSEKTP